MAACITAAARLMLASLEALVVDAGGTWAFCDTDSMAIVATETGGLHACPGGPERDEHGRECVRALAWAQVDEMVRRFESLNPYNRATVPGSVLEIEAENHNPATGERRSFTATRSVPSATRSTTSTSTSGRSSARPPTRATARTMN